MQQDAVSALKDIDYRYVGCCDNCKFCRYDLFCRDRQVSSAPAAGRVGLTGRRVKEVTETWKLSPSACSSYSDPFTVATGNCSLGSLLKSKIYNQDFAVSLLLTP